MWKFKEVTSGHGCTNFRRKTRIFDCIFMTYFLEHVLFYVLKMILYNVYIVLYDTLEAIIYILSSVYYVVYVKFWDIWG